MVRFVTDYGSLFQALTTSRYSSFIEAKYYPAKKSWIMFGMTLSLPSVPSMFISPASARKSVLMLDVLSADQGLAIYLKITDSALPQSKTNFRGVAWVLGACCGGN